MTSSDAFLWKFPVNVNMRSDVDEIRSVGHVSLVFFCLFFNKINTTVVSNSFIITSIERKVDIERFFAVCFTLNDHEQ